MEKNEFDSEELLALAKLDLEANRLEEALTKVKQGMEISDCPLETYAIGAKIYAQLRLFSKAKVLFERYLEEHPDSVTEKFQLGMVIYDMGNHQEALAVWQQLLDKYPTHPPALYYSSLAHIDLNDLDSAKRNIDVLLKSTPESNLYFNKGQELLTSLAKYNQDKAGSPTEESGASALYGVEN